MVFTDKKTNQPPRTVSNDFCKIADSTQGSEALHWTQLRPLSLQIDQYLNNWQTSPMGSRVLRRLRSSYPDVAQISTSDATRQTNASEIRVRKTAADYEKTDRLHFSLIEIAQTSESANESELAALTLLSRLRPGLCKIANIGHTTKRYGTYLESAQETQAYFFETVMSHNLKRRPKKIAANLILDTRQKITRSHRASDRLRTTAAICNPRLAHHTSIRQNNHDSENTDLQSVAKQGESPEEGTYIAVDMLRSCIETLPGSIASKKLTASLAFHAWVLEAPHGLLATKEGISVQHVSTRLHRLRSAIKATNGHLLKC